VTWASIVIPVFNREGLTRQCLESILLDWPASALEVVVVDDGSTDATAELLARLAGEEARLRVVSRSENSGFAAACNSGVAASIGEYVAFLNNDTIPSPGWLDRLVEYADAHANAAVVGSRLLFPDGTVQHAGVTIGQDRNPHHLYVGFPAEHPAVNHSGRVPVVTAACMLVRRAVFDIAGGFDTAFRNGHEDVDLCLRLGELGHEVHYCPASVAVHLESATRGRRTTEASANGRRYREEWAHKVVPSDLARFVEDGLVRVDYDDVSVRLRIDPVLGTADHGHGVACNRLLRTRNQQVADLLRTVVDQLADELDAPGCLASASGEPIASCADPDLDEAVIEAVLVLRDALAKRRGTRLTGGNPSSYRRLVGRVRGAIVDATPSGSTVAVVSRGDEDLLDLDGRTGLHFPSNAAGTWLGYHPAGSEEAIGHLDDVIGRGATYLAIPTTSIWWLDQYATLTERLCAEHRRVASADACVIFELATAKGST
jgi:GT2 family glycosyltransferase